MQMKILTLVFALAGHCFGVTMADVVDGEESESPGEAGELEKMKTGRDGDPCTTLH